MNLRWQVQVFDEKHKRWVISSELPDTKRIGRLTQTEIESREDAIFMTQWLITDGKKARLIDWETGQQAYPETHETQTNNEE